PLFRHLTPLPSRSTPFPYTTLFRSAWLVLGERMGGRGLAGLLVAFAGVTAVIRPSGGVDRDRVLGALLFVAGAACWGVYSVLGKDRKSTRLNSSHEWISYAVFCLEK